MIRLILATGNLVLISMPNEGPGSPGARPIVHSRRSSPDFLFLPGLTEGGPGVVECSGKCSPPSSLTLLPGRVRLLRPVGGSDGDSCMWGEFADERGWKTSGA